MPRTATTGLTPAGERILHAAGDLIAHARTTADVILAETSPGAEGRSA